MMKERQLNSQLRQKVSEDNIQQSEIDRDKIRLEQQNGNLQYQLSNRDAEIDDIKYKTNEHIDNARTEMEIEKEEMKKGYESQIQ